MSTTINMGEKMKILNLYSGLGGNRKLWGDKHEITAVEIDSDIAEVYKKNFPNDNVIVANAHEYLLKHYKEFDFIWSSPPCQSHSSFRFNICVRFRGTEPVYPDVRLWQEILFLQHHAKCKWVIENVKPYYKPFLDGKLIQRHMFWSNFDISNIKIEPDKIRTAQIQDLQQKHGFDLSNSKIKNKRQVLRNCVERELANHVLKCALSQSD